MSVVQCCVCNLRFAVAAAVVVVVVDAERLIMMRTR